MTRKNILTSSPPFPVEKALLRLGANLRTARLRRNLTIEQVAVKIGTGRHGISSGSFVYGRSYLERDDAVAIDPLELKLQTGTYETRNLKGIFGALRDARLVIHMLSD